MKKNTSIIIGLVVIVVLIGGGYAIPHKSSKPASNGTSQPSSQSSAPAVNNAVLITKTDSSVGQYLADPSGKTLTHTMPTSQASATALGRV